MNNVAKYVKKPIEIEAYQWLKISDYVDGETRDVDYYRTPHIDGNAVCCHCNDLMHNHGWIDTLEGGHIVCPKDFIITGIRGEKYPCKPDIFIETYDKV